MSACLTWVKVGCAMAGTGWALAGGVQGRGSHEY